MKFPRDLDAVSADAVGRAIAMGAAGAIPVIGSMVAALLDVYIPEQRARRTAEFLAELTEALEDLGSRVDHDFVRGDEFEGLVEEVLERVGSRRVEGMRAYYAAAVANSALPVRPDEQTRFRMLDVLAGLRPQHLALLAAFDQGRGAPKARSSIHSVGRAAGEAIEDVAQGLSNDVWADLAHLERLGLTHPLTASSIVVASDVRALLTPFGIAFLAFVGDPAGFARDP